MKRLIKITPMSDKLSVRNNSMLECCCCCCCCCCCFYNNFMLECVVVVTTTLCWNINVNLIWIRINRWRCIQFQYFGSFSSRWLLIKVVVTIEIKFHVCNPIISIGVESSEGFYFMRWCWSVVHSWNFYNKFSIINANLKKFVYVLRCP